jgi:hypothetical protein
MGHLNSRSRLFTALAAIAAVLSLALWSGAIVNVAASRPPTFDFDNANPPSEVRTSVGLDPDDAHHKNGQAIQLGARGKAPEGLTAAEWKKMQAAIERDQYRLQSQGRAYYARNHAQELEVTFSPDGFEVRPRQAEGQWRWGLHLRDYGYGDRLEAVAEAELVVSDNRIEYRRGVLVEWYVNGHRGLEQGFTLRQRPTRQRGDAPLHLHLRPTGDLRPRLMENAKGMEWSDDQGRTVLTYSGLYAYDATGRELRASMAVDGRDVTVKVKDHGAVYPVTIDPLVEQKKLTASDGATNDEFGLTVSISGDTAIVGARRDDDNGNESGSAYIFERNQGGANNWGEVKKLTPSDGAADDEFGFSVAISGDTAIVGARLDDHNFDTQSGSAYIFERNQGGADNWGQVKKLTASDARFGDEFGFSVALSGDAAIVGSRLDRAEDFGAAYIFERHQGGANNWGEVKKLTASDKGVAEEFGFSVAIGGDTAIVGARLDERFISAGSAYLFERNHGGANNWGEIRKLTASDAAAGDQFGYHVALNGDTAIVGAPFDDDNGNQSGSAYLFDRNQGGANNWGEVKKLAASDAAFDYVFGVSVALSGDRAIVGANGESSSTGAAYSFERNLGGANNWGEVNKLTASDRAQAERFGSSVAVSGDTAIVGAPFDDDNGFHSGSAYVFGEPDLVETAVSDPPAVAVLGQKFTIQDSAHNQGGAPAVATTTRHYLSLDTVRNAGDKRMTGRRAVPALAPGATSTGNTNAGIPINTKLGVYFVLACADDLKVEAESNETNNCLASATQVDVRAPDLIESAVSNPPANASPGGSFSVTDTARNQGNANAGASTTRYYFSLNTTKGGGDIRLTGIRAVPGLAPAGDSTGTVTVTIPNTTPGGQYFLLACADDRKKVVESDEANQCKASATTVTVTP